MYVPTIALNRRNQHDENIKVMATKKYLSWCLKKMYCSIVVFCATTSLHAQQLPGNWQLQLHSGLSQITGDVSARAGVGGGVAVQKRLSTTFAIRLDYTGSFNYGRDTKTTLPGSLTTSAGSDYWKSLYGQVNMPFVANYKAAIHQFSLSSQFNISSLKLQQLQPVSFYANVGYSFMLADVDFNAQDKNGRMYDFSRINFSADKSTIRKELKTLFDDSYEIHYYPQKPFSMSRSFIKEQAIHIGPGVSYPLTNKLGLAFEYRLTKPFSDYLDAISNSNKNDFIHYTNFRLSYNVSSAKRKPVRKVVGAGTGIVQSQPETITTELKFIEPVVFGEKMITNADTSYYLHFRFVPVVKGTSVSPEILYLRLSNGQVLVLPFERKAMPVPGSKEYEFVVKLNPENLQSLRTLRVTDFKFESTGYIYEDKIVPSKQDVFSSILQQLIRE
jgi:hypothetical protein